MDNFSFDVLNTAAYPSFGERVKQASGKGIDVSAGWIHILTLFEDDATEHEQWGGDALMSQDMATQLASSDADLFFVHFDNVDHTGHASGFAEDNPEYVAAMATVDQQVGPLLRAIESRATRDDENWLVIATTDHGGDGANGHGAKNEACQRIWLLLARDEGALTPLDGASQMDVYPSVLQHLGIERDASWTLDGTARVK
ncbi:MAG: alkaline phosphatase family protein [Polyangiaceae bacterium]